MKKRLLSTLLTLFMVLALLPVTALAAETSGSCGKNVTWSYSDGILTIQGTGPMYTFGDEFDDLQYWGFSSIHTSSIRIVIIGDGVTSIGEDTFFGCESLTSVTIPNSVTIVNYYAFYRCNSLIDVYYGGSEDQWKQIEIYDENDPLLNATIHYNSTGPVSTPGAPNTPSVPDTPSTQTPAPVVVQSPQKLAVNGETVNCEKYNIDNSNYFKLRDLAFALNGTGSQFDVGYDAATSTVTITTGKAYTPAGGELDAGVDNSASAQPSGQAILIDGVKHDELTAYNIGGSNFFQLRELGNVLGFEVDYDAATNTAIVHSK